MRKGFKVYVNYVENYKTALDTYSRCCSEKNNKFNSWLTRVQKKHENIDFLSILSLPLDHIEKMEQILEVSFPSPPSFPLSLPFPLSLLPSPSPFPSLSSNLSFPLPLLSLPSYPLSLLFSLFSSLPFPSPKRQSLTSPFS